jgi:hypothetical protein
VAAAATADPNEKVTLTVATFNDFGYSDALLAEYTKEHPNVTIVHNKAATSNDARANYFQKLGKTGLADIEAIEVDWMPEVMKYSDLLAPVPADLKGRWLDWKEKAATDPEGNLIGYGTDIGPEGVCYRSDLFAAAGLPTDRERSRSCSGRLGELLQGRRGLHRQDRQGVLRLRRRHLPGHDQPGRGGVREPLGGKIDIDPRSRRSTTRCSTPARRSRLTSASGPTTGWRACRTARSRRCSARAGCSVSSPATPRTSPAGTSPTSSPAAAATGAART